MAEFKTALRTELIDDRGSGIHMLLAPFVYKSDVLKTPDNPNGFIVVPSGFVTDFASVPRAPVVYFMAGNANRKGAVLHDWLYSLKCHEPYNRSDADAVLYEAGMLSELPQWRVYSMWLAVRMFGMPFWKAK